MIIAENTSDGIPAPAHQRLVDLGSHIVHALGTDTVTDIVFQRDELTLWTAPAYLLRVLQFLRDNPACRFKQLMDICGVDYPGRPERFEVVYHLLSLHKNQRIRIKVAASEETLVPSATQLFSCAGWWEREAWDLFGIRFSGHPDLRRILTDYGFEGHPLRKDFPLTGYTEVRYDPERQQVVYEPVRLKQDYRVFDFESPWEGMTPVLPGDEKADEKASAAVRGQS
jgi:NADH-quinone oxidoreductase subunit C